MTGSPRQRARSRAAAIDPAVDRPGEAAAARAINVLGRDLWNEVRDAFRAERGAAIADMWLKLAHPMGFARGVFTLGVPNEVVREWVDHRYRDALEEIFVRLTGSRVKVVVRLDPMLALRDLERTPPPPPTDGSGEEVLVCQENRLVFAAVQRVLREPATGNPVFLYGPAGTGKSLLVRHHLRRSNEELGGVRTTLSMTAEAFSQSMVRAIQDREMPAFRGRMLAADVFVMEEVHRLRGKTRTQQELLSVLRYHIERRRPVILTSRHPPNAIFLLDEGLRSWFLSGVLLRIADYSVPSRALVLAAKARGFARPVPADTIDRIANRVPGSLDRQVRFLEKAAAFAGLSGHDATPQFLAEKFPEIAGNGEKDVDLDALIERVAREFGASRDDLASNRKTRTAVIARHVLVFLATEVLNVSARRVVRHLGGLSPSTTAYARRKVEQRRRDDPMFDALLRHLMDEIRTGQKMLF